MAISSVASGCFGNINLSLPEHCLLYIFDRLSLGDLLEMDHVCPYWQFLQHKSGLIRRRVTLLLGDTSEAYYYDSEKHFNKRSARNSFKDDAFLTNDARPFQLKYMELNEELAEKIVAILPNIETLIVTHDRISSAILDHVISLLRNWSTTLITLKVCGSFQEELPYNLERIFISNQIYRLIHWINSLELLESLEMQFTLDIAATAEKPIDLPILSRLHLHEFTFYSCNDSAVQLYSSLVKYAQENPQLKQIKLGNYINNSYTLEKFLLFTPELAARFRHLHMIYDEPNSEFQMYRFGAHFTFLRSLTLELFSNLSITTLARCLAPIRTLHSLYLCIDFEHHPSFSDDDYVDVSAVAQLNSIEKLSFMVTISSHKNMTSKHISMIFPRLQEIDIPFFCARKKCSICKSLTEPIPDCHCFQLLLKPWFQCPLLTHIYVHGNEIKFDK